MPSPQSGDRGTLNDWESFTLTNLVSDWSWDEFDRKPSLLTQPSGSTRRRKPPKAIQRALIDQYGSCCAYCDRYLIPGEYRWDHVIPYAYLGENPDDNWALSCHDCNSRKGSMVFSSLEDARLYLMAGAGVSA